MNAMTQKLDKLNVHVVNSCAPSPLCDRCGALDHVTENCQVGNPFAPSHVEHVAYVNNFQPRPNNDPYSNSYNPGWKQHPNFSYKTDPLPFPQANARPAPAGFRRPSLPPQAPPPQNSNLESMLESVLLGQQKQDEYITCVHLVVLYTHLVFVVQEAHSLTLTPS